MIVTDLDGTLLDADARLSARNLDTLRALGARNVIRVVATGRSAFSANRVLPLDVPIDYLVVSSGAGIIDWRTGAYLRTVDLDASATAHAAESLLRLGLDFMVHDTIPNNHSFVFHRAAGCPDFERRVALYRDHCAEGSEPWDRPACQLVAIHDSARSVVDEVARRLPQLTVLRTTSPLDQQSCWIEVFPAQVSKSQAGAWIATRHGLDAASVVAVGNDTNDLDLLRWAGRGVVVRNAHPALLSEFETVAPHDRDGFTEAAALVAEL